MSSSHTFYILLVQMPCRISQKVDIVLALGPRESRVSTLIQFRGNKLGTALGPEGIQTQGFVSSSFLTCRKLTRVVNWWSGPLNGVEFSKPPHTPTPTLCIMGLCPSSTAERTFVYFLYDIITKNGLMINF